MPAGPTIAGPIRKKPMKFDGQIEILQVHCQGEIGKVVVSGIPDIPGDSMLARMNHINHVDDRFHRFLTTEPRASVVVGTNLLFAPCRPDADAGFIVLQADRAHAMSGSKWGAISADIAFGGVYYAIVDVERIGLKIVPGQARDLAEAGCRSRPRSSSRSRSGIRCSTT